MRIGHTKHIFKYAFFLTKLLDFSYKHYVYNNELLVNLKNNNKKIIFAVWHCHFYSFVFSHKYRNISAVVSMSKDGDLGAYLLDKYGFVPIRGSSSRGGVKALLQTKKFINAGYDTAIAIDGSKGPRFNVKSGPIYIAKLADNIILPVLFSINHYKMLNTWDRFIIPYPFAKIRVCYGEPFLVTDDKDKQTVEKERLSLQNTMMALTQKYAPDII